MSFDAIPSGDPIFVQEQAMARDLGQVENLLCFALNQEFAEFVTTNWNK